MAKKHESIFGEVEKHYYKKDIYDILENIMIIASILLFPFIIAGIIGGIYYKKTLILIFAIVITFIILIWFIYSFIMSYLIHKKGVSTQATIVKINGHLITYEYTNSRGIIIRSSGKLLKRGRVGLNNGSPIIIKVYKGRSFITSEY